MSIIKDISQLSPDTKFLVPTFKPSFVNMNFPKNVKPIDIRPWTFSLKLLGAPVLYNIRKSDVILITDAICFDTKMWDLLNNHLISLAVISWFAKLQEKPVMFFNSGVGPLHTKLGMRVMRYIASNADLIIVRDPDSRSLLHEIGVTRDDIIVKADSALNLEPANEEVTKKILGENNIPEDKPLIGINVTKYADSCLKKEERTMGRKKYQEVIASVADMLIKKFNTNILFIPTHPMDHVFARQTIEKMKEKKNVFMPSKHYTPDIICGLLQSCEFVIGTRFHSTVLSGAVYTPFISILYNPKNRSLMRQLDITQYGIEFSDLSQDKLFSLAEKLWNNRHIIRSLLKTKVDEEKEKARESALILIGKYKK